MQLQDCDILYVMKNGIHDEELRHSLRSVAANFPHRRVWMVGHKPDWVKNIRHIPTRQRPGRKNKYRNVINNLRMVSKCTGLSEQFSFFNDDFFVMRPIKNLPNLNRGLLSGLEVEYRKHSHGRYYQGIVRTGRLLRAAGWKNPVSYDLHLPMAMEKRKAAVTIEWVEKHAPHLPPILVRTIYGNLFEIGGRPNQDVKVYMDEDYSVDGRSTFLSTDDDSFDNSKLGGHIRQKFSKPCQYER